jgi:capsular polysaccharide export protein
LLEQVVKRDLISGQKVQENPALAVLKASRSVLLLQGPVGPFFDRLSQWLMAREKQVHRIVFSGGDQYDCNVIAPIKFVGSLQKWNGFFEEKCVQLEVDVVVLFGQSRAYHQAAIKVSNSLGIQVIVMEEGYFRPGFMTIELDGVNGKSTTLDRFSWDGPKEHITSATDKHPFLASTYFAALHYAHMLLRRESFPDYEHHRHRSPLYYFGYWVYSWFRKWSHLKLDMRKQKVLLKSKAYFYFVPLQFEGDAQLKLFSNYSSVEDFLSVLIRSFAIHAPSPTLLVFREHPHGRGMGGYKSFVNQVAKSFGVDKRIVYLVEGETPVLVKHSAGVITINSTVGVRALKSHVPLKVMGAAIYQRPGLVFDGELDEFWCKAVPVKPELAADFVLQLKNLTQVPVCGYATRNVPIDWR